MQTMHESETNETHFTSAASLWLVMMKAYRSMEAYIESTVAAQDIGLSDFMIMEALMHKGPMSMSQIGEKVLLANPSMTAAVDRLEKLGYVSRCSGTTDKRVRTVDLTKEGRKVIRRIFAQHEQDLEEVMAGVCATMRGPVRDALKKIGLAAKAKTVARSTTSA
ncbi:MarR family winged helix-turn-helix transcriptional regulator [Terriglobus sp. ADX1]|uniref:MarR family winged helix-turn-helix transcriptional regulator n=1 Tax=Terriglobus sp. ADX1 TaxID=2794063 RepID=UPI002FE5816B